MMQILGGIYIGGMLITAIICFVALWVVFVEGYIPGPHVKKIVENRKLRSELIFSMVCLIILWPVGWYGFLAMVKHDNDQEKS